MGIKQKIKEESIRILENRLQTAIEAMNAAQDSANAEEKSTAGDKHNTSRAMSQADSEMNARQVEQARRDLAYLNSLDAAKSFSQAEPGALITCSEGIFFLAAGLGTIQIEGKVIHIISPAAPVAKLFKDKKSGDSFDMNGKNWIIQSIS